jgi:predicted lipid carrier protein YhbT
MRSSIEADEHAAVCALFERLATHGPEPSLQSMTGTWHFDVENCGQWYVSVAAGSVTVSRDPMPAACTIAGPARDFVDVLEGRQNIVTAYLRGRLKPTGDMVLGLSFRRLLPVTQ